MTLLVSGARNWIRRDLIEEVLTATKPDIVVHGGARGADTLAGKVAKELGVAKIVCVKAEWKRYGGVAGVIRNQKMLDEWKPDFLVAFHEDIRKSKGTADMIERACNAGIKYILITGRV